MTNLQKKIEEILGIPDDEKLAKVLGVRDCFVCGTPLAKSDRIEDITDRLLTLYQEQLEGERERLRGIVDGLLSKNKSYEMGMTGQKEDFTAYHIFESAGLTTTDWTNNRGEVFTRVWDAALQAVKDIIQGKVG